MRITISLLLAALVLTLPLSVKAAPSFQSTVDIKALALSSAELNQKWRGFDVVPDRTVSEDRPDGVAVYDITYARERTPENLANGPFEVRSGVARTAQVDDAVLQLDSTKEAFLGDGWNETPVPPLGDDTVGLTQSTDDDAGKIVHFSYLFRKGSYILMIGVRGRPDVVKLNDAVGLAIAVSGRLDKALAGGAPASTGSTASSGPGASTGSPSSTTARQGTGERVKVVNADGGAVNMRSDASTSADVVTQVNEGTTLDVIGPNKDAEGRTWRNVRTSDSPPQAGWIASSFLQTVASATPTTPAAPSAPSPAPSPGAAPPRPAASAPAASQPAAGATAISTATTTADTNGNSNTNDNTSDASPSPSPSASPSGTPQSGAPPAGAASNTFQGSGNGLAIDGTIRDLNLSDGKQMVKVHVTRNGGPVSGAFVNVTARLDAKRFRSIKADNTSQDGYTELEWDMDGPSGTYEVQIDVQTDLNGPVTTAKTSFHWK